MKEIKIKTASIQLDQFLKWANVAASGGEAKGLIQGEKVFVNGKMETRRSVRLFPGDRVLVGGQIELVVGSES